MQHFLGTLDYIPQGFTVDGAEICISYHWLTNNYPQLVQFGFWKSNDFKFLWIKIIIAKNITEKTKLSKENLVLPSCKKNVSLTRTLSSPALIVNIVALSTAFDLIQERKMTIYLI
jgi:hypothetical protein